MPIYQYNGQHYDIATDDPEEAKRKIMASLPPEKGAIDYVKDFGKSTASLADTVLGFPAAVGQQVGYGVGRAFGLSPEEATTSSMRATQPFMTPVGSAFGITQDPAYQNEATKQIGRVVESNVVQPLARVTGLPEQDVGSMVNTGMMALSPAGARGGQALGRGAYATEQAVGRGARAVGGAVKATAQAPFQAAKGAFNAATGGETALAPLGKTYVTPEGARLFREGKIDVATVESPQYTRPIGELPTGAIDRAALKVAGNQIPLAGKGAQAFGERVMSDYIANPYKAAVDIGLPLLTGGVVPPIYALGRGIQAGADVRLAGKGFDPGLQQQVGAAKAQQAFQPPQPQAPRLPYNPTPAAGPVAPETMYATQSGQAGTNLSQVGQAALAEKYPPYTPATAPVTPAQTSQQAAAARIQPVAPNPQQQAILDQIRSRGAQAETDKAARVAALQQRAQAAGGYTPPQAPAPVAGPVAPAGMPATPPTAPVSSLDRLRGQLTPQTPEQLAAVEAYNALSPRDKAAQTRAQNKAPPGVSNMIVPESGASAIDSWRALQKRQSTLSDGSTIARYPYNYDKTIEVTESTRNTTFGQTKDVVYTNNNGSLYHEKLRGPEDGSRMDILDRNIELPNGTEIKQRFGSEMRNGQPVRTNQITVTRDKQLDVYIDGKHSHSFNAKGSLVNKPINGAMPDMESLIKKVKGE